MSRHDVMSGESIEKEQLLIANISLNMLMCVGTVLWVYIYTP